MINYDNNLFKANMVYIYPYTCKKLITPNNVIMITRSRKKRQNNNSDINIHL